MPTSTVAFLLTIALGFSAFEDADKGADSGGQTIVLPTPSWGSAGDSVERFVSQDTWSAMQSGVMPGVPDGVGMPRSIMRIFRPNPPTSLDFWSVTPADMDGSSFSISQMSVARSFSQRFGPLNLGIRPQYELTWIGGPDSQIVDLPSQLHGLAVDLRADYALSRRWRFQVAATPGFYTDFENTSGDAFLVPARLLATYVHSAEWIFIGGLVYIAQPELPIVPALGLIWVPNDRWRLEAVLPRPKIVYQPTETLTLYGIVSFGGQTYAVRADGRDEIFQYRDFRAGMGMELRPSKKFVWEAEIGAAFARRLEFEELQPRNIDPGLYLRSTIRF